MRRLAQLTGERHEVRVLGTMEAAVGNARGKLVADDDARYRLHFGGEVHEIVAARRGDTVFLRAFGRTHEVIFVDPLEQLAAEAAAADNVARAPMPGTMIEQHVGEGDLVEPGSALVTIESMKLLTVVRSQLAGTVAALPVPRGASFEKGASLCVVEPES